MAKKREKVSIIKLESALDKNNTKEFVLGGTEDVVFEVKKRLSLTEMIEFVNEVVESCVDTESGEYIPEAYNFALRCAILTKYANFTLPSNLERRYEVVYGTSAVEQALEYIDEAQFEDIRGAIDEKVSFMLDVISSAAVSKINEVVGKFAEIAQTSSDVFGGVDPEDMAKVMRGISKIGDSDKQAIEHSIADIILEKQKEKK